MMVLGVDYSVTCPAACLYDGVSYRWWAAPAESHRKAYKPVSNVQFLFQKDYINPIARLVALAETMHALIDTHIDRICVEDYAFGASGKITMLAEAMGIFKALCFMRNPDIPLYVVGPTKVKKVATGKGNAQKDAMVNKFAEEYPAALEWHKLWHPKAKKIGTSPLADVADAYFIARYGFYHV